MQVHDLATTLQMQNEELSIEKGATSINIPYVHRERNCTMWIKSSTSPPTRFRRIKPANWAGHVHSIKADNANTSTGMQGQLNVSRLHSARNNNNNNNDNIQFNTNNNNNNNKKNKHKIRTDDNNKNSKNDNNREQ